ncbi:hypothetical protein BN3659_00401 [Alistipes sp. CHKCI003]|nr:hypothetical protein BN3659_00401 [Alistipes sp. CHKCI003]
MFRRARSARSVPFRAVRAVRFRIVGNRLPRRARTNGNSGRLPHGRQRNPLSAKGDFAASERCVFYFYSAATDGSEVQRSRPACTAPLRTPDESQPRGCMAEQMFSGLPPWPALSSFRPPVRRRRPPLRPDIREGASRPAASPVGISAVRSGEYVRQEASASFHAGIVRFTAVFHYLCPLLTVNMPRTPETRPPAHEI